jgi:DNA-directed RNA polymerase specialized sigma24 family protein
MNGDDCEAAQSTAVPERSAPLEVLLQRLAASGQAAPDYERLRFRLITYFRLRFPADAEALADQALDRLAVRLKDGTAVQNLAGYALGIARLMVLETATRKHKEREAAYETRRQIELQENAGEPDPSAPALRACLDTLGAESAGLILEYYADSSGGARIKRRQRLAEHTGLTLNALRNRALRIRDRLERCVRARLQAASADPALRSDESPGSNTRGW